MTAMTTMTSFGTLPCKDLLSVAQLGAVNLPQTGRSQRLVVEGKEQFAQPCAELLFDDAYDVVSGNGTDIVLQPFQLRDVRGRKQVGAGGEHLTELDVRRPKLDESLPERDGTVRGAAEVLSRLCLVGEPFETLLLGEIG